jgi:uncharacterized protein (TIGR02145 family)
MLLLSLATTIWAEHDVTNHLTPPTQHHKTYTIHNNGTVTDKQTNLMWMSCSMGQTWNGETCLGEAKKYNWHDAQELAINFAGYDDWRMPTIAELNTLVHCSNGKQHIFQKEGYHIQKSEGFRGCKSTIRGDYEKPTIDTKTFPNTPPHSFWSSSLYIKDSRSAWLVQFKHGTDHYGYRDDFYRVRLVRDSE